MRLTTTLTLLTASLFFIACDSGSVGTTDSDVVLPIDVNVTPSDGSLPEYSLYPAADEPYFIQQWYIDKDPNFSTRPRIDSDAGIHTNGLLDIYSGRGVKVAIIDNGADQNHEDLATAIVSSYDIASKTTDVYYDEDAHGTAVTGIIGARSNRIGMRGIASRSWIMFLKQKEYMTDSETIELFDKAEEFGADVINCSWGTYDVSDAVKAKIVDLATYGRDGKGTLIVFAVGNEDKNLDNYNDESSIPEVIAVGATDEENLRAYYSNYGTSLDVMAPGGYYIGLTTTDNRGDSGYNSGDYVFYDSIPDFIGTSAAAPVMTGVLAVLLEKYPDLTRQEVMDRLYQSCDKIGNVEYDENGWNQYYGYGKVNLSQLLQ